MMSEYKISSADIAIRCDATIYDLIDVLEKDRSYIPVIFALNKIDSISVEEMDLIYRIPNELGYAKVWLSLSVHLLTFPS